MITVKDVFGRNGKEREIQGTLDKAMSLKFRGFPPPPTIPRVNSLNDIDPSLILLFSSDCSSHKLEKVLQDIVLNASSDIKRPIIWLER